MVFAAVYVGAQLNKAVYVKANAATAALTVLNAGVEVQVSPRNTIQADFLLSPWKSAFGRHARVGMLHLEGRHYLESAFRHFYVGINVGSAAFDITKYNYIHTKKFQRGFNLMAGAVAGYQFRWRNNLNIDLFLGGGTSQGFYHGYIDDAETHRRYDSHKGKWNLSGELIPYRGGIMIAYKVR